MGRSRSSRGPPPGSAWRSPRRSPRRAPTSRSARAAWSGSTRRKGSARARGGGGGAGGRGGAVGTDVAKPEDCQALVDAAMEQLGRVDVLVNNAGVGTAYPATRETPEQFRQVIDVNLNGCYWMAQACGRVMQPGSAIVNISSVLGLTTAGLPQAAYSASKAALIGLTRDL